MTTVDWVEMGGKRFHTPPYTDTDIRNWTIRAKTVTREGSYVGRKWTQKEIAKYNSRWNKFGISLNDKLNKFRAVHGDNPFVRLTVKRNNILGRFFILNDRRVTITNCMVVNSPIVGIKLHTEGGKIDENPRP